MKVFSTVALLAALCVSGNVFGWSSGDESMPGPGQAKFVLSPNQAGTANEHALIMRRAFNDAGVPSNISDQTMSFQVFTQKPITGNGGGQSLIPRSFLDVDDEVIRQVNLSGMAALPDHSYAIWDWLSGNEVCPLGTAADNQTSPELCHEFYTHLGAVNSNHFVPQAGLTYKCITR